MSSRAAGPDELRDFYERYIAAFNARDTAAFADFFHLPVTIMPLGADDERQAGRPPVMATEMTQLWPTLPGRWTQSTIDEIRVIADGDAFQPRDGLAEVRDRRPVLQVTVTRWAGDQPYEQVHVLYVLTHEHGRFGIKAMVPLAMAHDAEGTPRP
jgi:hypothetical protein